MKAEFELDKLGLGELGKSNVSRRTVLKGIGAVVATATVTGCSTSIDSENDYVSYKPDLNIDKDVRVAFSTGPYDCGGACVQKYHIKNDRILAMTSAGDIKRVTLNENDPMNPDEWVSEEHDKPMQYRACVKGYGYIQRIYQPDRIKYPLMQTKERGDVTGFVRVSWDTALEAIGKKLAKAYQRADALGYVPVVDNAVGIIAKKELPVLNNFSNPSQGNIEGAKLDAVGQDMWRNSRNDRFNSGLILTWGADPSRQSNWENGAYWVYQKVKETKQVPVITITPNCGGNAAMYSNSVSATIPADASLPTSGQTVKIPGWLPVRPGTDGALLTVMMYVVYRRKLYDYETLTNESVAERKVFGFWQTDSVTSVSPTKTHDGFPKASAGIEQWEDFAGKDFDVPVGYSFEEYLVSLEDKVGAKGWSPIMVPGAGGNLEPAGGGWLKEDRVGPADLNDLAKRDNRTLVGNQQFESDKCSPDDYYGVLEYASRLTGVSALVIEALACLYANNGSGKPSLSDIGCGPQRHYGGAEYVWLAMCLAFVCGHADKKGGGLGLSIGSMPDQFGIVGASGSKDTQSYLQTRRPTNPNRKYIVLNYENMPEIILNGRDGRDANRFREDIKWTTHGALDTDKIEIDVIHHKGRNLFLTWANLNKTREALNKLDMYIYTGQVMSSNAIMADVVLPEPTEFEQNSSSVGKVGVTGYHDCKLLSENVLRRRLYDVPSSGYVYELYMYHVAKALREAGIDAPEAERPIPESAIAPANKEFNDYDAIKETVEGYRSSTAYDVATGGSKDGFASYDRLMTDGVVSLPITSKNSIIALKHHRVPGGNGPEGTKALSTTTGYFNFFSPLWGDDRLRKDRLVNGVPADNFTYSAGWRTPIAKYVPIREGYERFFKDNNPHNEFTGYISPYSGRSFTLQYLTNKPIERIHTNLGNVSMMNKTFRQGVFMNSGDAARRGIKDGELVYVYNDRGCMKIPAIVSNYMAPGVISVEHGQWYKASPDETVKIYYEKQMGEEHVEVNNVPVDLGGAANVLTDDMFVYDPVYVRNTANLHGGSCEISKVKPE